MPLPCWLVCRGSSAVSLGFVIFILGWIIQSVVAFGYPFTPGAPQRTGSVSYLLLYPLIWAMHVRAVTLPQIADYPELLGSYREIVPPLR